MSNIKHKTITSVIWVGIGSLGAAVIGMIITMILARHLTPKEFGIIEVIMAIILISEVFVDGGFSQAVIKEKEIGEKEFAAIFTVNLIISIIAYAVIYFFTPVFISYFNLTEDSSLVLRVMSLKIIIDAFVFIQQANCTRKMNFKLLSKITLASYCISGIIAIIAVYYKAGIWALALYYIVQAVIRCIFINIKMQWRPTISFKFNHIKRFITFGSNLIVINVIDKVITNVESLCIGRSYTKTELGIFSQARKFNSMVIESLMSIVQKVTYPALAQINNEENRSRGYQQIIHLVSYLIVPITFFMAFNPENFMVVFFGDQWKASAPFLTIFSTFMMLFPAYSVCRNSFLVTNKTGLLLRLAILRQTLRVLAIIFSIKYGILTFAIVITITQIVTAILYIYYSCKILSFHFIKLILNICPIYIISLIGGLTTLFINRNLVGNIDPIVSLTISFIVFTSLYLLLSRFLKLQELSEVIQIVNHYKRRIVKRS